MNNYVFEVDKNIYRWTNKDVKIEFFDPHIQTHRETVHLTNPKDIMYFYYSLAVYHRDDNDEWDLLLYKYVYDFPALCTLINLLDKCLINDENDLSCKSAPMDDFYEIEYRLLNQGRRYTLTVGATPDGKYAGITKSIAIEYLEKSEVEEFSKMVKAFLAYAMDKYSQIAQYRENFNRKNKSIHDGKLFVKEKDLNNNEYLDAILVAGDVVDLYVFVQTSDGKSVCEKNYRNMVIDHFDENKQLVFFENRRVYKCSEIASIYMEQPTEKLTYDVPEIANDFCELLSDGEIFEFKNESEDKLFNKYCWLIIGRSWMCRDEHDFENRYPQLSKIKDTGNHERTFEVVRMVIRNIKRIL